MVVPKKRYWTRERFKKELRRAIPRLSERSLRKEFEIGKGVGLYLGTGDKDSLFCRLWSEKVPLAVADIISRHQTLCDDNRFAVTGPERMRCLLDVKPERFVARESRILLRI